MHKKLQAAVDKLETQKRRVLSEAGQLSEQQLQFRPDASTWSVLDVLDHLEKVERASFDLVRLHLPDGHPIAMKDRVGALMVTTVMKTAFRVKVPAGATVVLPSEVVGLAELSTRWNQTRESMAALLEELADSQLRVGLFRHPIGGWMNMAQTLRFLSAHLQHHVLQIDRVKISGRTKHQ